MGHNWKKIFISKNVIKHIRQQEMINGFGNNMKQGNIFPFWNNAVDLSVPVFCRICHFRHVFWA